MTAPPPAQVGTGEHLPAAPAVAIPSSHTQTMRTGSVGRALSNAAQRLSSKQLKVASERLSGDGGWLVYRVLNSARHACRALPLSAPYEQRASQDLFAWFKRKHQLRDTQRFLGDSFNLLPGDVVFFGPQKRDITSGALPKHWGQVGMVVGASTQAKEKQYDIYHVASGTQHQVSQVSESEKNGYLTLSLDGYPIVARGRWCRENNCDCSLPSQVPERYIAETPKSTHTDNEPKRKPLFRQSGVASWYGPGFHGRLTASGERYDMDKMTVAHKTLPFGMHLRVTNLDNGLSVVVRVTDRGPYVGKRILDLSRKAANRLDMMNSGVAEVLIEEMPPPWPVLDD